jgi:hypothetical protein
MTDVQPQIEVGKIQSELQIRREELALRQSLSEMTNEVRRGQSEMQSATKIASAAMQNASKNNK